MNLFEELLSVQEEDLEIVLVEDILIPWSEFLLNPRRLRGSDFLMRWQQGVWSEKQLIQAVNKTKRYYALPYGPSGTAPNDDIKEFELYFERLEKANVAKLKRPDLLIFKYSDKSTIEEILTKLGGINELPFIPEDQGEIRKLLSMAVIAVECENSLWRSTKMPDYGSPLTPQKRLGGKLGLKKNAVLPTVIIKEEDRSRLLDWQNQNGLKIHVWHVFYDLAFGLALDRAEELIKNGEIEPTVQTFQAPGGAITHKTIYKFYYHYAYLLGEMKEEPKLVADYIEDKNGHILPYVRFEGGSLTLTQNALKILDDIMKER